MHVTVQCPRCGKPLKGLPEKMGKRVRCAACNHDFDLPPGLDPSSANLDGHSSPKRSAVQRDDTLSRSMLPVRGMATVPPDEMLCRLEPGSLRWVNISEAVEEFLGRSLDQLRQRSFLEFLHPDDRALAEDEFRQAVERGERHDFVLRIPNRSGQMHYVRVYTQARYNHDGTINHIRCYLKDVTDRIHAEQELRRRTEQLTAANEQLRQINRKLKETQSQLVHSEKLAAVVTLAAGMAHEINNPLAFAMNNVAVLERDLGDLIQLITHYREGWDDFERVRPDLAEKIGPLQEDADLPYLQSNLVKMTQATRQGLQRVAKIVENLRGFAQVDRAEFAPLDINQALEQSVGILTDTLRHRRVTIEREYEPLPLLEAAGAHLNQAFMNLLTNGMQAIEATGRGSGTIRLSTHASDGEIVVEVTDNGCGMPADVLPRIFDPFFTTKPVGQGTGLGLSIGHGIIADHGGRIEVHSIVGVGSTFRMHLPTEPAARRP
jgi:PAS domain S-box-containing protein